ncbi:type I-D CRISPR-associated protein Cas10d/Csc3 [Hazenella sp. IB182353]|uniref:type I-D CRISPR-associated protein Cas10d/Csc3 n=1 Tax=Polycladospora coralii TaxID=2771432 RepID=UPI0017461DCC|nr:type I-D CRISPR-associated protein Cas10d/Csc3 [Polycladospora coralii]MBS7531167.1 type I-D CRISPR-associated protein Cas10d/Csc3 [Polycladospora coralii]
MNLNSFAQQLLEQFEFLTYNGITLSKEFAKSYDYHENHDRNLYDLSMFDHIRTGLQAGVSLIEYLQQHKFEVDHEEIQYAFIAYVLHDLHKSKSINKSDSSEYDMFLTQIEDVGHKLCENLAIAAPPAHFLRLAGVSNYSNKQGDASFLPDGQYWSYIRDWVKLLDKVASITSIAECLTHTSVRKLEQQLRQILPPIFHKLHIQFHYVQEVRGIITTLIHNGMAHLMDQKGYLPWLRFGDGTLYLSLGTREVEDKELFYPKLLDMLIDSVNEAAEEIPVSKLFDNTIFECQLLSFMIYSEPEDFSSLFYRQFSGLRSQSFPENKFTSKQLTDYGVQTNIELFNKLGIIDQLDEDIRDKWMFTSYFFAALQRLTRRTLRTSLSDALQKIAEFFKLPCTDLWNYKPVKQNNNKKYDGAIWLAYRFMQGLEKGTINQISIEDYRLRVRDEATSYLTGIVNAGICKELLNEELPIQQDFYQYLHEQLVVSWDCHRQINQMDIKEIEKAKKRSQKKICNLCNRSINSTKGKVRATVIEDAVNVFSNRVLPRENKVDVLHWCTVCELEFTLRQVFNINILGNKSKTRRVYLYAIPSFQFTTERLADITDDFDYLFGSIHVHAERGPIRDAWQTPFVSENPTILRKHFQKHFEVCSEYYQAEGHTQSTGDVLRAGPVGNIIMLTYDCYSGSNGEERTRDEVWMKALSAALSIHQLYGFRVLLTEKPFLFISDIREILYAVNLDAPPLGIGRFVKNQSAVPIEQVEKTIFSLAALWEVYQVVYPYDYAKRTDKAISTVIHELYSKPLPGAYFFKRWATKHARSPISSFTYACQQLNQIKGGLAMSLIKNLTSASLALYRPYNIPDGRAHRFENLFRLTVKGIKEGADKSVLSGLVMKRLERLVSQKGGRVALPIKHENISQFVDLVYDQFYLKECCGKLAKLVQKQNSFADGIFFETYQTIQRDKQLQENQ